MEAEDDYLKPILGDALYEALLAEVIADTVADEYKTILHLCRKVAAPLSVLLGISTRHIKIGDSGLKKTTAEGTDNVFAWEYREVKDELQNKVAKALDNLWKELYGEHDYEWGDTSAFQSIFKTAADFANVYPLHQPYRIFPLLQPVIVKVEELFINDSIGEAFYNELIENTDPSDDEAKAIKYLKMAIANLTIHKSISDLPVKITPQGFTVLFHNANDQPYMGEQHAPDNLLSMLRDETLETGRIFLNRLKKLLNEKASDEVFATYKNSSYYSIQPTTPVDRNESRQGIVRL